MRSGIDWVVWGLWVTGGVAGGVSSTPSGVEPDVGRGLDAAFLRGIASKSGKMGVGAGGFWLQKMMNIDSWEVLVRKVNQEGGELVI